MTLDDLTRRAIAYADDRGAGDQPLMTEVPGLSVLRQRAPTPLASVLYQPIFCLVLQGAKQVFVGDRTVTFARMQSVIISIELPAVSRVVRASHAEPYVALALQLDMALTRELAAEIGTGPVRPGTGAIAAAEADDAVLEAMGRLFSLVDKPEPARVLRPLILREIHYWLLTAGHGAMLRSLAVGGTHAARIAEAAARIRRDFAAPLRVADLARTAGMSPSAFHDHFKAITGTTPLQYQKQLRLMEARRLMLGGGQAVSSVAFAVGYESPTQFSREYARKFGASPRNDLAAQAPA